MISFAKHGDTCPLMCGTDYKRGRCAEGDAVADAQDAHATRIAQAFHESYEEQAHFHGYKTREASAKPWADVPEKNKRLMIATAYALLDNGAITILPAEEGVSAEKATEEKGYPHPGSTINLPDNGGQIKLQYGHPQEVGRNGCFMHDVLQGIIDNLSVYQQEDHPLACTSTAEAVGCLKVARQFILDRRSNRKERGVHQTDKP